MVPPAPNKSMVKASYSYKGKTAREMTMKKGDMLTLVSSSNKVCMCVCVCVCAITLLCNVGGFKVQGSRYTCACACVCVCVCVYAGSNLGSSLKPCKQSKHPHYTNVTWPSCKYFCDKDVLLM